MTSARRRSSRRVGLPERVVGEPVAPPPLTDGNDVDERGRLLLSVWSPVAREVLKLVVIVLYLVFAAWLTFAHANLGAFVPLLPWALGISVSDIVALFRREAGT
jgi:hypothetical protein